jgi:hypothetical protein
MFVLRGTSIGHDKDMVWFFFKFCHVSGS